MLLAKPTPFIKLHAPELGERTLHY